MSLQIETAIASKILSAKCSDDILKVMSFFSESVWWLALQASYVRNKNWHYKHHVFVLFQKLAHCLALLPRLRGDEESWSLMIQKVLLSINSHLNDLFQGLEEGIC